MAMNPSNQAQLIPPDAYPQMVSKAQAAAMARTLHSAVSAVTGARVIDDSGEVLRQAVRLYVTQMEDAGMDVEILSDKAHEIRGLAGTAGMPSTGRIADGLCRYFDEAGQSGLAPDAAVVRLHVSAIIHTARDPDTLHQMDDVVARELSRLAARKLAAARNS